MAKAQLSSLTTPGIATQALAAQADALRGEGACVMVLSVDKTLAGLIAVADPIKATTPEALTGLKAAGIRVVKGDLRGILRARALSEVAVRNIRQNLAFAFVYNALGVSLAAGVLYPFTGMLLSPLIAAAAMSVSSLSVVSNALRLRSVRV